MKRKSNPMLFAVVLIVTVFALCVQLRAQMAGFTLSKTVTTAGTRVQISSTSLLVRAFAVCAQTGNTGHIYFGGATVTSANGVDLSAGDCQGWPTATGSGSATNYDLSKWYVDSSVNGEGVNVIYAK